MIAPKSGFAHYTRFMATLRINNVPDELHERLRRLARKRNCTMSAIVLAAVEREIERFEWRERMANRPIVDRGPDETVAEALAEARAERDRQMDEWARP